MPVVTLSIEEITNERIEAIRKATRRTRSAVVDLALECLAQQEEYSVLNPPTAPQPLPTYRKPRKATSKKGIDAIPGVHKGLTQQSLLEVA